MKRDVDEIAVAARRAILDDEAGRRTSPSNLRSSPGCGSAVMRK